MAKISNISIKRFKRLGDISIDLGTTTLLIGSNNSGKSSVLQAIQFAVSLAQSAKLVGGVQWANDKYELSFGQQQLLYCPVSDAMTLASGGQLVEDAAQRIEVTFTADDNSVSSVILRKGRNRNLMVSVEGRALGEKLQDHLSPFSVYAPGLAGIPRTETCINPGLIRRTVARGDANLILRNVLLELSKDPQKWQVFLDDMRKLFPDLEIVISFDAQQDEHIGVRFTVDGGPQVPFDAAGTAILQSSQLLSYVTLFQPAILILDEPDSHLHPDRQRHLCRLLCSIAEARGFQIVLSSHSRHVLDALALRATVVWLSKGAKVPDDDVDTQKLLLELGALDSVDYLAGGGLRCLVATEDTDQQYIRALLEASGFPMEEVEVASYPGCSQVEAAIVLGCFLQEKAPNIKLVIHRDRDYLSDQTVEDFESKLRAKSIHPWVTEGNDIESHFCNSQHLAGVNPGLDLERAQQLKTEVITECLDQSVASIVNSRTQQAFRERNRGGDAPNHGQIAVEARRDFDASAETMSRGDIVLGRLVGKIQQEIGRNPIVVANSTHLDTPSLRSIKDSVWPEQNV